jgi:tetratricopeptide (TPR) repeat protein
MTLNMSRAAYYRHRAAALQAFAEAFAKSLAPTVQLEQPNPPSLLLGRDGPLQTALQHLQAGASVGISGPSGVGKTQLGQAIAAQFAAQFGPAFWFTVRPPLNDQLSSFVFALAHRLRQSGASQTWRQLISENGATKPDVTLGLLQFDLAQLRTQSTQILLCIDEADLLHGEDAQHAALLQLLDALRASAPLLFIGQRQTLLTQHAIALGGLGMDEALALLAARAVDVNTVTMQTAQQVLQATQGNPLLLTLFASLHVAGEPTSVLLRQLARQPNVPVLLERLWARLSEDERALWCSVAVCRQPAPRDAWQDDEAALQTLVQRGLVREQDNEAVYALPPVREFVLAKAEAEMRASAHAHAAQLFECRAQFTAAAWHYVQAGMPEQGIWLWFKHRERETGRGLAQSAQTIFADVALGDLRDEEAQRALALLRSEWHKLAGTAEDGLNALGEARWPPSHPHFGYAQRLRGNLQEMRGQLDQAAAAYREGLQASAAQQTQERIRMWTALGYAHFRQREMHDVRNAALQAQIEALDFRGYVETQIGNLVEAEIALREGLLLAEQMRLDSQKWQAGLHDRLGIVLWQSGRIDEAVKHLQQAMQLYEQMGDSITPLYQRMNLAAAHIVAGEYGKALDEAQRGLRVAQSINHAYLIAGLSLNAAEAHFYLGQWDEAERQAGQCMNQEESAVQPYAFTVMGMVQRARGQASSSQNTLRTAIANAQQIEDRYAEACAWRELGRTLRVAEQAVEARAAFDEAVALFEAMGLMNEIEKTRRDLRRDLRREMRDDPDRP